MGATPTVGIWNANRTSAPAPPRKRQDPRGLGCKSSTFRLSMSQWPSSEARACKARPRGCNSPLALQPLQANSRAWLATVFHRCSGGGSQRAEVGSTAVSLARRRSLGATPPWLFVFFFQGVAQLSRALRSGRKGRECESHHPDLRAIEWCNPVGSVRPRADRRGRSTPAVWAGGPGGNPGSVVELLRPLAQPAERLTLDQVVQGATPWGAVFLAGVAQQ